jgi:hypothetical protein
VNLRGKEKEEEKKLLLFFSLFLLKLETERESWERVLGWISAENTEERGRLFLWFCLAVFLQKRKRWAVCCNGQNRKIEGRKVAGNRDKSCRKIKETERVLRA